MPLFKFQATGGGNNPPNTPSITSVDNITGTSCRLHGSTFSDPDGDSHAASQWQVDVAGGDFSSPVHDSGETSTDLTQHDVTGLQIGTDYKARVRYKDDSGDPATEWSAWSGAYSFSTLHKPDTPSITSVTELYDTSCTLHGSTFNDADGDGHAASQWQVDLQTGDFSSPVHDSGETTQDLTSHHVAGLTKETNYKARVRYKDDSGDADSQWSDWSDPYNFTTKGDWTGIQFSPDPADGELQVPEGTPIKCDVTDNWYFFQEANITIRVEGTLYDHNSPEVSYENITDGKRIIWTPPQAYKYGRGNEIDCRVDAKNDHNDESAGTWSFWSFRFVSIKPIRTWWNFKELCEARAEVVEQIRQPANADGRLVLVFRPGSIKDAETRLLVAVKRLLNGEAEPTLFVCELKRTWGPGSANVAEVKRITGEGGANIQGYYLVIAGGSANIQAYMIFVPPAGSGNIQISLLSQGEGAANIGVPARLAGEGSARIFKVEKTYVVRVNAIPPEIKAALEEAGVTINA